ncbi:unnamed protein product, partial [Staurois parvus]
MEPEPSSVRRPESGHMAECGDGIQQQWEAVQGPMTDYEGPGSSMRRRYRGPWQITGLAAAMGGLNLPAPYQKGTPQVRSPKWPWGVWRWNKQKGSRTDPETWPAAA